MFVSRLDSSQLGAAGSPASGVRPAVTNLAARVAEAGTQTDPLPADVGYETGRRSGDSYDTSRFATGADPAVMLAKMVEPWQLRYISARSFCMLCGFFG